VPPRRERLEHRAPAGKGARIGLGSTEPRRPPRTLSAKRRASAVLPDAADVDAAAERLGRVTDAERVDGGVLAADPSGNTVLVRS
jgi:hypothetical protein